MNDDLIAQINEKIAVHLKELAALQAARKVLSGRNDPTPLKQVASQAPAAPTKKKRTPTRRAKPGFLEGNLTRVVKANPGLTNKEIRDVLENEGYKFSLSGLHIGKRLSALVGAKRLTVKLDGTKRKYYPAR